MRHKGVSEGAGYNSRDDLFRLRRGTGIGTAQRTRKIGKYAHLHRGIMKQGRGLQIEGRKHIKNVSR